MSSADLLSQALDKDIAFAHQRFVAAMEARLPTLEMPSKERYFAILTLLVGTLAAQEKTMRAVLVEVMAEASRHLMEELSAR